MLHAMAPDRGAHGRDGVAGRPTLRDVARLAGVSTKTASRVLNGERGVAASTAQAVERAMRQLDYRPNFTASSLRRAGGRTKAIAAILEDVGNPFSAAVLRALEDTAREQGVLIIAGSIDEDPAREQELVRAFVARRADALVIAPASHSQAYLNAELASGTPIVVVDRAPVGIATDAVLVDNHGGARRAVEHLLAGGHRRIGYLGDLQTIATARLRYRGYADALHRAGVDVDPRLVVHDLHNESTAHDAALGLLAAPLAPTALFTAQNNVTVGAVRGIHQRGIQHRVALVGFDDIPLADVLSPGISVIAQDPSAIGRLAAEVAFRRLAGDRSPPETVVVPTELRVRGSGELPA